MQQTECAAIGACVNAPCERKRETRETSARARTHARTHARKSSKGFRSVAAPRSSSCRSLHARVLSPLVFLILLLSNSTPREQVVSLSLSCTGGSGTGERQKRLELVIGNNNTHWKRRVLIVVIFQGQFSNHGCCCCCFSSFG
jgi:hypothetical protein